MKNRMFKYVSIKEMNELLEFAKKYRRIRYEEPCSPIGLNAFIEDGMVKFKLTMCNEDSEVVHYIAFKDDRELSQDITGGEAYRILRMNAKFPLCKGEFSASPFLWFSKKYEGQWVDAICYDMNSAYGWAMCQPMPDTSSPPKAKEIEDGEVGFDCEGDIQRSGYSLYVFKMLDYSPFENFARKWFKRKKDPKFNKQKAKNVLVYSVGFLQRKNPYLRAYIVGLCNEKIHSLIDNDTIYCNTDSIVSLKERPDLKLGTGLGEWKIEHKGKFAYNGFNYQWKDETIAYRGVPKSWFSKNFDITKDDLPIAGNLWYYDNKKFQLRSGK